MGCTPPFSSSLFLGCTWASPLSFSGIHFLLFLWDLLQPPPFEGGTTHLLILVFLQDTLTQLLFFPGGTHTLPSPSVGCACTSLFIQDLPTHPLLLLFFLGCTHASSPFLQDALLPSSFFWDAPLPPPPFFFFLQDTLTQVLLLWDGLTDLFFFRMHSSISSFFLLPPNLILCKDQLLPGPLGTIPCTSLWIPTVQPAPKVQSKNPTEDVFGKISTEAIWGREQSDSQAGFSMQAAAWEMLPRATPPREP